jgi:hypothetical protein
MAATTGLPFHQIVVGSWKMVGEKTTHLFGNQQERNIGFQMFTIDIFL